ncbi:hypothetical protein HYH03_003822 [Edaphochlamys debaryana]|uniref:START domain-containing protein n=1 Tax=Edaphochlamys debaryana TaxID=47281 RepID=A0A835Y8N8_9CHLO|nr:hypothetical protein HYH03_003822 [Edaphochlamys debaryana]|eukprot:KAG2498061.1 hypothetical protein HYH03_003822 [Edaphochlamys debaryana]
MSCAATTGLLVPRMALPSWHVGGAAAAVCVLALAARSQGAASLPETCSRSAQQCLEGVIGVLFETTALGSPAQWVVALLGLMLYPALSSRGRVASGTAPSGSAAPAPDSSSLATGPRSFFIQLEQREAERQRNSGGLLKRLRRMLSQGQASARQALCGSRPSLNSLSRKRSFGSRSSKSEDVLSSRLSMDSRNGQSSSRRGLQRIGSSKNRWQPSMTRISSGVNLADMSDAMSDSTVACGKRLEILSYNGFQAVDCLAHEQTDPDYAGVRQLLTDTNLLQFGAMIGEASAELALSQAGSAKGVGPTSESLFGAFDKREEYRKGWEMIVEEHKPGLHYWVWRRQLRHGLFMYKSKTLYEAATAAQVVGFTFDSEFRKSWDDSTVAQLAIPPPPALAVPGSAPMTLADANAKAAAARSAFMYNRTKFPPPMAARDYTYVRRVWAKPDDGGLYCINHVVDHPSTPAPGGRSVRVGDFASGFVIRSSKGVFDTANPAAEIINVYFEDAGVAAGFHNMGVRRGLWPFVQKAEKGLRDFLLTREYGGLEQPPPERPALDSLGAALDGGAGGAARAAQAAADADAASCLADMGGARSALLSVLRWRLGSPLMLLYSAYLGAYRAGRSACLGVLSCLMSLWCNATSLGVAMLGVARNVLAALAAAPARVAASLARGLALASRRVASVMAAPLGGKDAAARSRQARRVAAQILWPWEALFARRGARSLAAARPVPAHALGLERTTSDASVNERVASHPLPAACTAERRVTYAPVPRMSSSGGGAGSADGAGSGTVSPRGSGGGARKARAGGAMRRAALVAVKLAKVAGAGLLLGRRQRAD